MTFKVQRLARCVIVSKKVPIRNVRRRFSYGFEIGYSTSDQAIEDGICRAKKRISLDIKEELIAQGVEPPMRRAHA